MDILDHADASEDFYKETFDMLENSAIRLVNEIPDSYPGKESIMKEFSLTYLEFIAKHMKEDGAYYWAINKKDDFLDVSPLPLSEKNRLWKSKVENWDNLNETFKNEKEKSTIWNDDEKGCSCLINVFLIIMAVFTIFYVKSCIEIESRTKSARVEKCVKNQEYTADAQSPVYFDKAKE